MVGSTVVGQQADQTACDAGECRPEQEVDVANPYGIDAENWWPICGSVTVARQPMPGARQAGEQAEADQQRRPTRSRGRARHRS